MIEMTKYNKKTNIDEAFLTLLEKRPLNRVYVTDICEICGISRKTYYKYYSDPIEQFEKLMNQFIDGLNKLYDNSYDSSKEYVIAALHYTIEHRKAFLVFVTNHRKLFREKYMESTYERMKAIVKAARGEHYIEKLVPYYLEYAVEQLVTIEYKWIKDDMDEISLNDFADFIDSSIWILGDRSQKKEIVWPTNN